MSSRWCLLRLDRWLGLSAAMVMMGCAGLTYTYAVYSEQMKLKLHFTQEQIDDIGAAKDFGGVVAWFSGVFYNLYPPWATIAIGASLHFYGYLMVWMTVSGRTPPSFLLLCVYIALGNGGDGWIDTACMMTSLQNYEEHRGTALGILKAQLGLSSATFVMIYEVLLAPNVDEFLLLMALLPTVAFVSLAFLIRPFEQAENDIRPNQRFNLTFNTIVILGLYMMFSITSKELLHTGIWFQRALLALMLAIMIAMYIIPIVHIPEYFPSTQAGSEGIDLPKLHSPGSNKDEEEEGLQLLNSEAPDPAKLSTTGLTFKDCVLDYNFWLLFAVTTIGAGVGVAIINNFAQIGMSLRAGGTDVYVGLISIWSCFGRLLSGYGSDYLLRRGFARTTCLLISQVLMALCCLLLATGYLPSLFIGSALTGLSYGSYWTLVPAILSEVFGLQNFTILYKLVSLGPPVGSYLLSAKVLGHLYDEQAELYLQRHPSTGTTSEEDDTCYGPKCFGDGLLVLCFISFIGSLASFMLVIGTRKFYRRETR